MAKLLTYKFDYSDWVREDIDSDPKLFKYTIEFQTVKLMLQYLKTAEEKYAHDYETDLIEFDNDTVLLDDGSELCVKKGFNYRVVRLWIGNDVYDYVLMV